MKKLIPLLLILVLFACAKKEEQTPATSVAEPTPATETATTSETVATETAATDPASTTVEAEDPATETAAAVPEATPTPSEPSQSAPAAPESSEETPEPTPVPDATSSTPAPAEAPATTPVPDPPAATAGDATLGAAVVKAKCKACHGADGSANTTMGTKYDLRDWKLDAVQTQTDTELARVINEGSGKVSAGAHKSKKLSADDVDNVVAFIRSLK